MPQFLQRIEKFPQEIKQTRKPVNQQTLFPPLYRASNGIDLMRRRFLVVYDRGNRIMEIPLRHRCGILPIIVHSSLVLEFSLAIEDETMRGAECAECSRDLLRFIEAIREGIALLIVTSPHLFEGVLRIILGVVAIDEDELRSFLIKIVCESNDAILIRLRIGAMVAGEDDDKDGILDLAGVHGEAVRRRE